MRLAVNEAGKDIEAILKANGVSLPDADWSDVFPHWLNATEADKVIGCCQIMHGKPVGFVEFLYVDPKAPYKLRVIALHKLAISAMATLNFAKSKYIAGFIDQQNWKLSEVLQKHKFIKIAVGAVIVKVLV